MPRYEKVTPKGVDVVEIELDGTTIRTRRRGKLSKRTLKTVSNAVNSYEGSIAGLKSDGFVHASERHVDVENPDLERAIFEHPDDDDPRIVYGDWLQEQGDPRGDLVALQRAGSDEAKALLAEHGSWLYGQLDEMMHLRANNDPLVVPTWRLGFLDAIEVRTGGHHLLRAIWALARTHSARFLRTLTIGGDTNYKPVIALLAKGWPKLLRRFRLAGHRFGDTVELGSLAAFCRAHPALEELLLDGNDVSAIPGGRWPALHTFAFTLSSISGAKLDSYFKLFDASLFPKLRTLRISYVYHQALARDLAAALRTSSLCPQLDTIAIELSAYENMDVFEQTLGRSIVRA